MKLYQLTKKFRFETAHRLSKDYVGKCSNIHGHSWNGEITVSVEALDNFDMGVDFADIKPFIKEVEDLLDHKIVLWVNDPLVHLLQDTGVEIFIMQKNPTSEAIAEMIYGYAVDYFSAGSAEVFVDYVSIEETCTSKCVYSQPYSEEDIEDDDED